MGIFGCHVSTSGGVQNAPERGRSLGCEAMQIFTANQRQWQAPPLESEKILAFRQNLKKYNIKTVVSHDSYLVNLGSPDPDKLSKSRHTFLEEIRRCDALDIPYLVFHPGSFLEAGEDECLTTIAASLDWAVSQKPEIRVRLLLENTAGQGTNVGYRLEHLNKIIKLSRSPEQLGVCLDTAHAFAAGYDIRDKADYADFFQQFDEIIGLEKLAVFHLNDSKKDLGSRVDRHDVLGSGFLGWAPFQRLARDPRFSGHPMLLETPGGDANFAREIELLKQYRSE